ncbi:hypothetical protein [Agrobacterium pusense]|uniref:hypothetical protein n=1 Tax=Agrobacterium pusense TaxID=648995 RepID=UPI0013008ED4|nr:hypothetical protein [Agrobacterium pusense]
MHKKTLTVFRSGVKRFLAQANHSCIKTGMARPKKPVDELKDQRVPIMMSEDELKAIDDWRFENRIASRGEAIRRLCQIGLKADEASGPMFKLVKDAARNRIAAMERLSKLLDRGPLFLSRRAMIEFAGESGRAALDDARKLLEGMMRLSEPLVKIKDAETIKQALIEAKTSDEQMDARLKKIQEITDKEG